jgi:hypothetical protein
MIRTIREACRRLERSPYYRQLTRSQGGPGLWSRILLAVILGGGILGLGVLLRPSGSTPVSELILVIVVMTTLFFTPSIVAVVTTRFTLRQTQSESFKLVQLANNTPEELVDTLAGGALYVVWPVWLVTVGSAALSGVVVSLMTTGIPAVMVGVVGLVYGGAAVWFGVWSGVIAGLKQGNAPLISALFMVNGNVLSSVFIGGILTFGALFGTLLMVSWFPASVLILGMSVIMLLIYGGVITAWAKTLRKQAHAIMKRRD